MNRVIFLVMFFLSFFTIPLTAMAGGVSTNIVSFDTSTLTQNDTTDTEVISSATVRAAFTDADGDPLTYSLATSTSPFTISSTNGRITLTRTLVQTDVNNSPLTGQVVATDEAAPVTDQTRASTVSFVVIVLNVNDTPVASPTAVTASSRTQNDSTGTVVRDSTRVQSYFTDIDGDTLTYSLATSTSAFTISSTNGQVTLARTLGQADVNDSPLTVDVVASDGSLTATTTLTVPVLNVNDAPVASPTAVTASSRTQNDSTGTLVRDSTRVQSYFTDVDGDTLTYSLSITTDFTISSTNGQITLARTLVQADVNNSPLTVDVVATDDDAEIAVVTLTVPVLNVNDAPVASPTAVTASSRTQNDSTGTLVRDSTRVQSYFTDADGDTLTYSLATSTSAFTISSTNGQVTLARTLGQADVSSSPLTVDVLASDGSLTATTTLTVPVLNVNDAPVANPIAVTASSRTQNDSTGTLVRDATRVQSYFTDADGDTLTYSLANASTDAFTISSTNGQVTLMRTLVQADVSNSPLTVDVVASDGSLTATTTLTVPVLNVNEAPVANPIAVTASSRTQNDSTGTLVRDSTRVQSYFTDADGDTLTYSLANASTNAFAISSTNGQVTLMRTLVQADVSSSPLTVDVVASDGSLTATTTLTVPVLNVNDAPVANPIAVTASSRTQNDSRGTLVRDSTRVQSYFTDADGDTLTYSLANASTNAFAISSTNGQVTLMRTLVQADVSSSPLTVDVVASDGSLTATTTLTVPVLNVNDAPVANPIAVTASSRTQNDSTGTLVRDSTRVQSYFTDADGDTLTYSLANASTDAFTISSTNGQVTLMRTLVQADVSSSPLTVDVVASDGSLTATTTLTVPVLNVNDAPVANPIAVTASSRTQNDSTGTLVRDSTRVQSYFTDADGDTLTYSLANASTDAFTISSTNGQVTLMRTLVQADVSNSPLTVDVVASDGSLTATTTLTVPVLNVNEAPVANPIAVTASSRTQNDSTGTLVRDSTRVQSYFTDADGDTLTYSLANASTNAFAINSTNGQVTLMRTLVQADVSSSPLTVDVVASDGSLTATTTLTVPVLNVNDAPVANPIAVTASSRTQNDSTGTLVRDSTRVQSYFTDADGDTLTYSLANPSTNAFAISSTNGQVTLMRTLVQADVSSSPLTVDVVASDGSLTATTTLTVPVLNVNDAPVANPVAVTASSRTENQVAGTEVRGSAQVISYFTDVDGDTLTYSLANPSTNAFTISSTNGQVTLMRTLVQADVNSSPLTVDVVASDGSLTATTTLTVPVLNVDNAPVASPIAVTASSRTQNQVTGTEVRGSAQVQSYFTDADGDTLTYSLANPSTNAFTISSTNGQVTLMRTLVQADVNSSPLTVDVVASDGSLTATTTLTVPVLNVNDAPVANPVAVTASSRTENQVAGTEVRGSAQVISYFTDIDGDTLTYSLANPSTNAFAINSTNGQVTLMRTLVQADVNSSPLTVDVVASDGSLTATTTLTVPVLNVDNPPVANPVAVTASSRTQNEVAGTEVRGSAQVQSYFTDADGDTLTYSLANESTNAFTISSTNGQVTLMRTLVQADVSSSPLTVDVAASDGSLTATTTLTVPVLNVNDGPVANPVAVTAADRTQNEVAGTVVRGSAQVQSYFTDADGDTLTYSLANESTNAFTISSTNGQVTLMRTLVQADVNSSILTVDVVASDGSLTATTTLAVRVLNVNDAPVANPIAVTASSRTQDQVPGTEVRGSAQVTSYFTDADGDTLTYTLANPSTNAFTINSTNGQVTLMRTLVQADVNNSPLTVAVVASDGTLTATTTLTVPVLNVNEAPVANPVAVTASSRTQNQVPGTEVRGSAQVISYFTDADGDTLTYSLANESTNAFTISSTNGQVTLMRTLVQADVNNSPLTVDVVASDGRLTATTTLTVPVLNVNDAPIANPVAVTASSRTQNDSAGTLVRSSTQVQSYFTDVDGDTLTYSLANANAFTISSTNGQVTLMRTLEQTDVNFSPLTVDVVASDGSLTATTTLTVPVLNVNEAPVASQTAVTASSRTQNEVAGTLVHFSSQTRRFFTDVDGDTLTYSLANPSTNAFTISSTNGQVTLMRTLVQADVNSSPLTVDVVASDGSLTATTTLTVPVLNVNDAPVANPIAVTASSRTQNEVAGTEVRGSAQVTSYFTDADGDTLTYSLANASTDAFTISSTNGQVTLMRTLVQMDVSNSPLTVDVVASDGSLTATTTLTVPVLDVDIAPVANPIAVTASSRTQNEVAGTEVRGSAQVTSYFTDADGDTLTYSLDNTSTNAFTINSTNGQVTLMRTLVQADVNNSPLTVDVVASDGRLTATTTLTVPVLNVNDAPIANPLAVTASSRTQNEMAGTEVRSSARVQSYFTDVDGDTLTYSLATTNDFTISSTNGQVTLARTLVQADVNNSPLTVDVVASDGSLTATTTLTVPVLNVNDAPVANDDVIDQSVSVAFSTLNIDVLANDTDVDGDTLSVASVVSASNLGIYTNSSSMVLFTASDALFRRSGAVYSTAVYTVTDSQLTSTALVTIRFSIPNDLDGDGIGNVLDLNPTTSSGSITLIGTATISSHQFLALQTIGLTTASLVSDSDGDTWPDVVELLLNTSITSVISSDADADGIPDEVEMYLSSQTSSVTITAVSDRDNDGFYDIQELRLATNPFSAASIPVHSTTTADTDRDGILDTEEVFIGLSSGTYTTQTALAVTNTLAFSDVNGTAQSVNTNVAITINASTLSRVILTSSTFIWDISGAGIASTSVQTTGTILVVTPLSDAALMVTLTIDEPITRNNLRIPLLHVSTGTVVAAIAPPPASSDGGSGGCSLNTNANTDGILWLLSLFALFMILRSRRRA